MPHVTMDQAHQPGVSSGGQNSYYTLQPSRNNNVFIDENYGSLPSQGNMNSNNYQGMTYDVLPNPNQSSNLRQADFHGTLPRSLNQHQGDNSFNSLPRQSAGYSTLPPQQAYYGTLPSHQGYKSQTLPHPTRDPSQRQLPAPSLSRHTVKVLQVPILVVGGSGSAPEAHPVPSPTPSYHSAPQSVHVSAPPSYSAAQSQSAQRPALYRPGYVQPKQNQYVDMPEQPQGFSSGSRLSNEYDTQYDIPNRIPDEGQGNEYENTGTWSSYHGGSIPNHMQQPSPNDSPSPTPSSFSQQSGQNQPRHPVSYQQIRNQQLNHPRPASYPTIEENIYSNTAAPRPISAHLSAPSFPKQSFPEDNRHVRSPRPSSAHLPAPNYQRPPPSPIPEETLYSNYPRSASVNLSDQVPPPKPPRPPPDTPSPIPQVRQQHGPHVYQPPTPTSQPSPSPSIQSQFSQQSLIPGQNGQNPSPSPKPFTQEGIIDTFQSPNSSDNFSQKIRDMQSEMERMQRQMEGQFKHIHIGAPPAIGKSGFPDFPPMMSPPSFGNMPGSMDTMSSQGSVATLPPASLMDSNFGSMLSNDLGMGAPLLEEETKGGKKQLKLNLDMHDFSPDEVKVKSDKNKLEVTAHHEEKDPNRVTCRVFHQQYHLPQNVRMAKMKYDMTPAGELKVEGTVKPRHRVKWAEDTLTKN